MQVFETDIKICNKCGLIYLKRYNLTCPHCEFAEIRIDEEQSKMEAISEKSANRINGSNRTEVSDDS